MMGRTSAVVARAGHITQVRRDATGRRASRHVQRATCFAPLAGPRSDTGVPLDSGSRHLFERTWHQDFAHVRVHAAADDAKRCARLGAEAFTSGEHLFFGAQRYRPDTVAGRELIGHELWHVLQQRVARGPRSLLDVPRDHHELEAARNSTEAVAGRHDSVPPAVHATPAPLIQRRLIVGGDVADILELIDLLEPAVGQDLEQDPLTGEITILGPLALPATSPSAAAILNGIITDPAQDSELAVSEHPARVMLGAFPVPQDLTAGAVQRIDIADIRTLEAGAPGHGIAVLVHEIEENY
ncbi:MAG TPA: DUF4157 domain-containing protein, partial [Longimicrobiales bacterium]|nr:DUF4157 domain-containing protein [Longimicrobiales bacterium]